MNMLLTARQLERLRDLPPARHFVMDQRSECRWRTADCLATDIGKAFLDLGLVDDAIELGIEASDYR